MGPSFRDLRLWAAAILIALAVHFASLPSIGRWIQHAFAPTQEQPPLSIDLQSLAPPPKKEKIRPEKNRVPEQEKELSTKPDQINRQARRSSPSANASELGTKKAETKQRKLTELKKALKKHGPLSTGEDGVEYAINTYQWSYKRFMENWSVALSKRWLAPADYLKGAFPKGGYVWVKVTLTKDGRLDSYEVLDHNVSEDMALMVVYAVMGVRSRPALPADFPEEHLIAYWRFIYPTFEKLKAMIQQAQSQQ